MGLLYLYVFINKPILHNKEDTIEREKTALKDKINTEAIRKRRKSRRK